MSEKLSNHELSIIIREAMARLGSIKYKNKKSGEIYTITKIVLRESDCTPMVEYFRHWNIPWARPLDEFLEKFEKVE